MIRLQNMAYRIKSLCFYTDDPGEPLKVSSSEKGTIIFAF